MRTLILRRFIVAAVLLTFGALSATEAQAQYTTGSDFDVSWTLDPRSDATLFDHGPAFGARSVLVGMDFDGDGNKEFLFTTDETLAPGGPDPGTLDIYLYETDGDDSYTHVWHFSNPRQTNSLPAVAYADIDSDGLWEIYIGMPASPSAPATPDLLFIFEQDGSGVFPDTPTLTYNYDRDGSVDFRPSGLQIVDVDNDGNAEIITTSRTSNARELVIMELVGASLDSFSTFAIEFEADNTILGGGSIYDVDVVDFDDDGLMEIWVNTWNNWSMTIFEATAADTYVMQVDLDGFKPGEDPGSFNSHKLLFADIDNDSKLEGFFPMTDGNLYFLANVTDVSVLDSVNFPTVGRFGGRSRGADIGDIDGDGLLDIIAGTGTEQRVMRMEYDGTHDPTDSTSYAWSTILDATGTLTADRYYPLRIADDLDGDGHNEIVITNLFASDAGQDMIIVLEHNGGGTAIEEGPTVLDGFTLHSNYPNPFSNETTVQVELERPADVSVEVYDLTGRRVRTLMSGMTAAGSHEVAFESQSLPSGLYLIRFGTPSGSLTRTAMLVR